MLLAASAAFLTPFHHHAHRREHPQPGCHRRECDVRVMRWWARHHRAHRRSVSLSSRPMVETTASWYYDAGPTACGFHAALGVANKVLNCGSRVRICHAGACETAVVDDRGPYVAGRDLDLDLAAKDEIGCSDLCDVVYAPLG